MPNFHEYKYFKWLLLVPMYGAILCFFILLFKKKEHRKYMNKALFILGLIGALLMFVSGILIYGANDLFNLGLSDTNLKLIQLLLLGIFFNLSFIWYYQNYIEKRLFASSTNLPIKD